MVVKLNYSWKMFILLSGFFFFLKGSEVFAQIETEASLEFPTKEEALEVAQKTVRAYEQGNWEDLRNHVKQDATFYNLGSFDSLSLDQTIQYWKKGREIATPVLAEDGVWLAVSVPEGPRQGNWILHWGENRLSYPNGENISFPYHVALKFEDQKVSEAHFYYDNNRIIRALGYEIQPPLEENSENQNNY